MLPFFCLCGHFLVIVSLVFSKFWHGARSPYEVVRDKARFSGNIFLLKKLGKWPKIGFLEFIEKFGHEFILNLFYNENIIDCVPAQILHLGKVCSWDMGWLKCSQPIRLQDFIINHIAKTSQWNCQMFCILIQVHINVDQKIFWIGMVWSWLTLDSEVDCISRINRWNELIFYILVQIQES